MWLIEHSANRAGFTEEKVQEMNNKPQTVNLNQALKVFFKDALRIALTNPSQAFSFLRTLRWLAKAARTRAVWKDQGIHVPPIIIFSVTHQCNLQCKGCYARALHQNPQNELSAAKIHAIIAEAKELGVSFFVLAGGEPFMRPEIFDIIGEFPEIIFLIFTNGLLIDAAMVEKFRQQKNIVPLISLEGDLADTDERRGLGTHEQLLQTMSRMKRKNIFFGNSLTLTRQNFKTIVNPSYIQNLVRAGCKFFLFIEYTPVQEGTEDWVLTAAQRSDVGALMQQYRADYPALFIAVPWDEVDVGGCLSAGRGFVHVSAAGDLEPCPFAPFSDTNLRDSSLKDALQSDLLQAIRAKPELARENGDGCILWKERELVQSLMHKKELPAE